MHRDIQYEMTDDLATQCHRSLTGTPVKAVLLIGFLVCAVAGAASNKLAGRTAGITVAAVLGTITLIVAGFAWFGKRKGRGAILDVYSKMPHRTISVRITDEKVTSESALGSSIFTWDMLSGFTRYETHWNLAFLNNSQVILIPIEKTDEELKEYLIAKSRELGVKSFSINRKWESVEDKPVS